MTARTYTERDAAHSSPSSETDKRPPRGPLSPEVEKAARAISREVWHQDYTPGEGPMHFAGGSFWHDELQRRAKRWLYLAACAELCAQELPNA